MVQPLIRLSLLLTLKKRVGGFVMEHALICIYNSQLLSSLPDKGFYFVLKFKGDNVTWRALAV
jgi:hypothetical protein